MIERQNRHYIIHKASGLPIRISPDVKRDLRRGNPHGEIQLEMLATSAVLGNRRSSQDTVEQNFAENVRLRRIARKASSVLVNQAQEWGIDRYCTVVHGSVARGLVRHPTDPDPSDIDIDLVINTAGITKEERLRLRNHMYHRSREFGARVDTYVWDMDEIHMNTGNYARLYLASSAYPIANTGSLWEEIRQIGLEGQQFLNLNHGVRKKIRHVLLLLTEGQDHEASKYIESLKGWEEVPQYLREHAVLDHPEGQANSMRLMTLLNPISTREHIPHQAPNQMGSRAEAKTRHHGFSGIELKSDSKPYFLK